jgi:hypothetical protein
MILRPVARAMPLIRSNASACTVDSSLLGALQELLDREANVLSDLPEERRRDITSLVKGEGCPATVGVPKLLVGATLSKFAETKRLK